MKARMDAEYGAKKGDSVFYASVNAGKPGFSGSEPTNAVQRRLQKSGKPNTDKR